MNDLNPKVLTVQDGSHPSISGSRIEESHVAFPTTNLSPLEASNSGQFENVAPINEMTLDHPEIATKSSDTTLQFLPMSLDSSATITLRSNDSEPAFCAVPEFVKQHKFYKLLIGYKNSFHRSKGLQSRFRPNRQIYGRTPTFKEWMSIHLSDLLMYV